jgi:glycerol kinase
MKICAGSSECLPEIRPTATRFGAFKSVPVTASLVDQQAALFGHGCSKQGDAKITFGTGAFALAIAGERRVDGSRFGILPTVAWRIGNGAPSFALDGGVYNAASAVNWARSLGLFRDYNEIASFEADAAILRHLAFVPALSGIACPHWDRNAAGLWIGMGLDTTRHDMMQALLEGVALRAAEVIAAMSELLPFGDAISVDGGLSKNPYFLQFLANALQKTIVVPGSAELTALGTARLAMLGAGAKSPPSLPQPKREIAPKSFDAASARHIFSEAVSRARNWKSA